MPRATKSRSQKSRSLDTRQRSLRPIDLAKMRRYLAFVHAVVGVSTKPATR